MNRFYNFKGLHTFKEKFKPRWEPRYLVYPSVARLPKVALALIRADSGDDFLAFWWKSLRAREPSPRTPAPQVQAPLPEDAPA